MTEATHADAIRDLAETDSILRAALDAGERSGWSRELTLEVAVLMLAAAKAEAFELVLTATADRPDYGADEPIAIPPWPPGVPKPQALANIENKLCAKPETGDFDGLTRLIEGCDDEGDR